MKLSKRTLLLIVLGVLVVTTAGLSLVRSQQIKAGNELNNKLALAQNRLKSIQLDELSSEATELGAKLSKAQSQFEGANTTPQQIGGTTAINRLYEISNGYDLEVTRMAMSGTSNADLGGITYSVILLKATVEGSLPDILDFVSGLNGQFKASVIKSIVIDMKTKGTQLAQPAPDFELPDLNGQITSLSKLKGGPVLIYFWASWSTDSRNGILYIQQIYEKWSSNGLAVRAIDVGESSSQIAEFVKVNKLSLPILFDTNGGVAQKYSVASFPVTLFIDKDGMIQQAVVGAFSSKDAIESHLSKIIPNSGMAGEKASAELELAVYSPQE